MNSRARFVRPAFTIVPLALILWLVLVVLGVLLWQKTPPPGYVPSKGGALKSDRFFVKSEADRKDHILDQLNGR